MFAAVMHITANVIESTVDLLVAGWLITECLDAIADLAALSVHATRPAHYFFATFFEAVFSARWAFFAAFLRSLRIHSLFLIRPSA